MDVEVDAFLDEVCRTPRPLQAKLNYTLNWIIGRSFTKGEKLKLYLYVRCLIMHDFPKLHAELTSENLDQLRKNLLILVYAETSDFAKQMLCDMILFLAENLLQHRWPEFLPFLFYYVSSPLSVMRVCGGRIYQRTNVDYENQDKRLNFMKKMLQQALMDGSDSEVRVQAYHAACAFIVLHKEERKIQDHLQDLLPNIIQVFAENFQDGKDSLVIEAFVNLCQSSPTFLKSHVEYVLQLCLQVLTNEKVDKSIRTSILEAIKSLYGVGSGVMKTQPHIFINPLVGFFFTMMVNLKEDTEWSLCDESSIVDDESVAGESSLNCLVCALGGEIVFPYIQMNTTAMLRNNNWKYKHAASIGLLVASRKCYKQMEPLLPEIIENVQTLLLNEHPRVQYAACKTVCEMAIKFAPALQKNFHENVVPSLLLLLNNHSCPRVQAVACAALGYFFKNCPACILTLYSKKMMLILDAIVNANLTHLREKETEFLLKYVVDMVASVFDMAEKHQLDDFYDRVIQKLKYIVDQAVTPDLEQLRSTTTRSLDVIEAAMLRKEDDHKQFSLLQKILSFYRGEKTKLD